MKGSSVTSAKATASPPPTGPSSASNQRSRTDVKGFALTGPSHPPDPSFNAYRADLADVALASCVIASHYAEPLTRRLAKPAALRTTPADDCEPVAGLQPGDHFEMLDDTLGWAWGYAGAERRVGYVRSEAIAV